MRVREKVTSGGSVEESVHTEGPHVDGKCLSHLHGPLRQGHLLQRPHTHSGRAIREVEMEREKQHSYAKLRNNKTHTCVIFLCLLQIHTHVGVIQTHTHTHTLSL